MGALIANANMAHTKSSKDAFPKEFHNNFGFIGPSRDGLNPFRNIVHS